MIKEKRLVYFQNEPKESSDAPRREPTDAQRERSNETLAKKREEVEAGKEAPEKSVDERIAGAEARLRELTEKEKFLVDSFVGKIENSLKDKAVNKDFLTFNSYSRGDWKEYNLLFAEKMRMTAIDDKSPLDPNGLVMAVIAKLQANAGMTEINVDGKIGKDTIATWNETYNWGLKLPEGVVSKAEAPATGVPFVETASPAAEKIVAKEGEDLEAMLPLNLKGKGFFVYGESIKRINYPGVFTLYADGSAVYEDDSGAYLLSKGKDPDVDDAWVQVSISIPVVPSSAETKEASSALYYIQFSEGVDLVNKEIEYRGYKVLHLADNSTGKKGYLRLDGNGVPKLPTYFYDRTSDIWKDYKVEIVEGNKLIISSLAPEKVAKAKAKAEEKKEMLESALKLESAVTISQEQLISLSHIADSKDYRADYTSLIAKMLNGAAKKKIKGFPFEIIVSWATKIYLALEAHKDPKFNIRHIVKLEIKKLENYLQVEATYAQKDYIIKIPV